MELKETKKIAKEVIPLLKNTEWDIYKSSIIMQPVNEILRGVCFNRSGLIKTQFELRYFAQPLYVPHNFIVLSFGDNINSPNKRQWWDYDPGKLKLFATDIAGFVNKMDMAFFSKITCAEDFYKYYKSKKKITVRHYEAVAYSAAYAGLSVATEELKGLLSFLEKSEDIKVAPVVREMYHNAEKLYKGDRKTILKEWEMQTRIALKLPC